MIALVLLAVAVAGVVISFKTLDDIAKNNEIAKADVRQMKEETGALRDKGEKVQQTLTPAQRELLVASHKLVASKSFGWSRLFADLESLLPGSVSVSRISVQDIFKDGDKTKASLDFSVLSRDYQSVMTMIDNMNNSGVFQAELRSQDLQKTDRITYTEYTLNLTYVPAYSYSNAPNDVARRQTDDGGNQ